MLHVVSSLKVADSFPEIVGVLPQPADIQFKFRGNEDLA
jgi:hypothetical protein